MRIGILGGGQLGWMTILEGRKLGYEFYVLDESPKAPAAKIADRWFPPEEVEEFSKLCDVITYEFEHIRESVVSSLVKDTLPSTEVLKIKRSRVSEKGFLSKRGYPVANFKVMSAHQIEGLKPDRPLVAKAESLGYDGKGQYLLRSEEDILELVKNHSPEDRFVVEEFVNFIAEVSSIAVRDIEGNVRVYPLSYNFHSEGILLYNYAPYNIPLESRVREIVSELAVDLGIVGLLAVEFFVTEEGEVLINEFAPRPHNTGHYTLDGSYTSQFESLLRAITGLPLGRTGIKVPTGMVNLLGLSLEDIDLKEVMNIPGSKLYWYGKEKRPRRKVGHINISSEDVSLLKERINRTLKSVYGGVPAKVK